MFVYSIVFGIEICILRPPVVIAITNQSKFSQTSTAAYLEYVPVEKDHDDAGDVEATQGRVHDKVAIVENAEVGNTIRGIVEAQDNWAADCRGYGPNQ